MLLSASALLLQVVEGRAAGESLRDVPVVWHEDDRRDIAKPTERAPNVRWAEYNDTIVRTRERIMDPVRIIRHIGGIFGGDHVLPAANINSLDEVPNSSWFTNRLGMFPMTPEEVARGPGSGTGPDRSGPWTIISAKSQGVAKGFNIRDANGQVYLIKFDPPGYLGMTTGAGVIANRILYAAGYNVPDDAAVTFARDDLVLGEGVKIRDEDGKRPMTEEDLDMLLSTVDRLPDGRWLAISSKFLSGETLGPFDYQGSRKDDPNDRVEHQNRRELRGLYVFAAWLNHFDTKQENSLDMYVTEGNRHYVKHYLIDLASTLGAGGRGPSQKSGYEYTVDVGATLGRLFTLGLKEDRWRLRTRPQDLPEVGYFVSDPFRPDKFKPHNPNPSFANTTDRDAYWAAKIVAAFSDDHIRAIAGQAHYPHQEAEEYVARVLIERRDKITRHYFGKIAPLDFFVSEKHTVRFLDLAEHYGLYPGTAPRYRLRCAVANDSRTAHHRTDWEPLSETSIPVETGTAAAVTSTTSPEDYPYLAMEVQVNRGSGWSKSVTAYRARVSGRIVAIDR